MSDNISIYASIENAKTRGRAWIEKNKKDGDILIHCGDFSTKLQQRDFEAAVEDFDRFLGSLGHRHKVPRRRPAHTAHIRVGRLFKNSTHL